MQQLHDSTCHFQHLHDELQLLVLKSASPRPLSARRVQAAVCKRWENLVRREEVCWLQVRSDQIRSLPRTRLHTRFRGRGQSGTA